VPELSGKDDAQLFLPPEKGFPFFPGTLPCGRNAFLHPAKVKRGKKGFSDSRM
jgi:hypothetical protein